MHVNSVFIYDNEILPIAPTGSQWYFVVNAPTRVCFIVAAMLICSPLSLPINYPDIKVLIYQREAGFDFSWKDDQNQTGHIKKVWVQSLCCKWPEVEIGDIVGYTSLFYVIGRSGAPNMALSAAKQTPISQPSFGPCLALISLLPLLQHLRITILSV